MRRAERKVLEFERFKANKSLEDYRVFGLHRDTIVIHKDNPDLSFWEDLSSGEIKCVSTYMKRINHRTLLYDGNSTRYDFNRLIYHNYAPLEFKNLDELHEYMLIVKLSGI
jgi:hypothetical protein